ncbi:17519_t:CDS:2 [Racocetra persica]|uniref:17519_t:CDS:1 n=1 Tax=Racocetra persica TaxID=160502 RepID=A0ACA9KLT1_9GLOM|nr:17519_t:CDS:2 [Racocetra persica]
MSGNEDDKYLKTRRAYNETKKAYIERISKEKIIKFIRWTEIDDKTEFVDTGGSGVITRAKWIEKNITVVLKAVAVSEETNSDNDEFIKEIKAFHNIGLVVSSITNEETSLKGEIKEKASLVGYENVIKFYGVSRDESDDLYLILEYANHGNLRYFLSQNTLNWEQKVNIARQVTGGLYFLHKNGILHRDLHTKNVLIQKDGDDIRAIITDFGLAKVIPRNSEKLKDSSKSCISDIDTGLITPNEKIEKESNKTNNEQIFNKMLEMFGLLSTKDLEMFEQLSAKDPRCTSPMDRTSYGPGPVLIYCEQFDWYHRTEEMVRLVQAAAAYQKKAASSEKNGQ